MLHCPYCHGWEVRDKRIGILATGPAAVHQALLFQQLSPHVTVLRHTGPAPDADQREQLGLKPAEVLIGEHPARTRIEADRTGATAVPGVWVAGNLTDPQAQVIAAAAGGLMAGAAINFNLVLEEARLARSTGT